MLRQMTVACVIALLACGLAISTPASAETIGDCCLTGYTFMQASGVYTSTPAGPNTKDYFRAQSLNWDYSGQNMYGYGWAKFDNLASEAVAEAHLVFDLLANGSMSEDPVTPEEPAELLLYDPGSIDVADLEYGSPLLAQLRDNLDTQQHPTKDDAALNDLLTMTSVGTYSIEITELYNAWVANSDDNHGVVFVAPDDGNGGMYASFDYAGGNAPYISTVPVPEPSSLLLLVAGAGMLAVRMKRSRAR